MLIMWIGMILIVLAWLFQLARVAFLKDSRLNTWFLCLYGIGVVGLVLSHFKQGNIGVGLFNLLIALIVLVLLILTLRMIKEQEMQVVRKRAIRTSITRAEKMSKRRKKPVKRKKVKKRKRR